MSASASTRFRLGDMVAKSIATGFGNAAITLAGITIFHFWGWTGLLAYVVIQFASTCLIALGGVVALQAMKR